MTDRRPPGRPPKPMPPTIPDTLDNVLTPVVKTRSADERKALEDDPGPAPVRTAMSSPGRARTARATGTLTAMTTTTQREAVERAARVRRAARQLATASTDLKNTALLRVADAIEAEADALLAVNHPEIERARSNGLADAFLDRMTLTPERIAGIARDARAVAALPDPVGEVEDMTTRPNGLQIGRMRVPLGVIGAVYEYSTRAE